ncbi:ABC transporter ATP-binding protein [Cutibacterium avidum 44067]|nr:ABC transporter ATP-binding protein [Cutibacterium avidum 44067]
MIAAVGVSKSFGVGAGRVEALRSVDIEFSSSGLHAVMGESGSGKSTLINLLAGLDVPDAGEIEVNRKRVSELDEAARARHRLEHVSVIFQDNNLIAEMTNIENVALPLWARGQNRAQGRRAAEDALARLGIDQLGDRRPSEVSGGQRQRVRVARALAGGNEFCWPTNQPGRWTRLTRRSSSSSSPLWRTNGQCVWWLPPMTRSRADSATQ